ncbi:Uncharacterised protein [Candidatus Tiddalikarchaeum anstoanum]|nr:Uncharacterised protein [Candidatus Tiddalikarchaeum anstoanum]
MQEGLETLIQLLPKDFDGKKYKVKDTLFRKRLEVNIERYENAIAAFWYDWSTFKESSKSDKIFYDNVGKRASAEWIWDLPNKIADFTSTYTFMVNTRFTISKPEGNLNYFIVKPENSVYESLFGIFKIDPVVFLCFDDKDLKSILEKIKIPEKKLEQINTMYQ